VNNDVSITSDLRQTNIDAIIPLGASDECVVDSASVTSVRTTMTLATTAGEEAISHQSIEELLAESRAEDKAERAAKKIADIEAKAAEKGAERLARVAAAEAEATELDRLMMKWKDEAGGKHSEAAYVASDVSPSKDGRNGDRDGGGAAAAATTTPLSGEGVGREVSLAVVAVPRSDSSAMTVVPSVEMGVHSLRATSAQDGAHCETEGGTGGVDGADGQIKHTLADYMGVEREANTPPKTQAELMRSKSEASPTGRYTLIHPLHVHVYTHVLPAQYYPHPLLDVHA